MNFQAIGATLLPIVVNVPSSIITRKSIKNWYQPLKKPWFCPPNWVFGPMWSTLYISMGYASYLVFRDGGGFHGQARWPLQLYASQLALNVAWTPIFFGAHKVKLAFFEMCGLWGMIAATTYSFFQINQTAGFLMLPYQLWVTLAGALNYSIWKNNDFNNEDSKDK